MKRLPLLGRLSAIPALAVALGVTVLGQVNLPVESIGGPLTGPPVLRAPFSADATTIVHATLGDGTRLNQATTDRYYRDSRGRVRVERWVDRPAPSTVSERWLRTIVSAEAGRPMVYGIDDQTRSIQMAPRTITGYTTGGGRSLHVYIGDARFVGFRRAAELLSVDPFVVGNVREESLGNRRIAGVETTGRRVVLVVPPGYRRNDRPDEITDERWESDELKLLVQFRHSDSRSTVEYRLSNIRRDEPPADLFQIPEDYTTGHPLPPGDRRRTTFVLAENYRGDRMQ